MRKLLCFFFLLCNFQSVQSCCISLYDTRSSPIVGGTVYSGNVIFQPFTSACASVILDEIQVGVVMPSSNGYQVFTGIYDENKNIIKQFKNIKEGDGYLHIADARGLELGAGNYFLGIWSNKNGPAWTKTDQGYWGSITGECVVPEPSGVILGMVCLVVVGSYGYYKKD